MDFKVVWGSRKEPLLNRIAALVSHNTFCDARGFNPKHLKCPASSKMRKSLAAVLLFTRTRCVYKVAVYSNYLHEYIVFIKLLCTRIIYTNYIVFIKSLCTHLNVGLNYTSEKLQTTVGFIARTNLAA